MSEFLDSKALIASLEIFFAAFFIYFLIFFSSLRDG